MLRCFLVFDANLKTDKKSHMGNLSSSIYAYPNSFIWKTALIPSYFNLPSLFVYYVSCGQMPSLLSMPISFKNILWRPNEAQNVLRWHKSY